MLTAVALLLSTTTEAAPKPATKAGAVNNDSPTDQFALENVGASGAKRGTKRAYQVAVSYVPLNPTTITATPVEEYKQPASMTGRANVMFIYPDIKFQVLSGIGGCFNEIGGEALAALDKGQQADLLNALFNVETGSAFTFCRAAIGASDFAFDAYSFADTPGDYDMKHFSLKRDKEYMLPFMQKAIKVNPDLRLFTSPWSPPAWMKESGYMDQGMKYPDKNGLIDDVKIYKAYALYFSKYVKAYAKEGVEVERILVQNEQDSRAKFPSCRLLIDQMTMFVKDYMRPQFEKDGIKTEIWAGTFRTATEADGLRFAAHSKYRDHFDGMGVQYTRPQYIQDITILAPDLKIMHTEGACFNGQNSAEQAQTRFVEVASYINGGSENYCYWNMILNETGKSGWDWRQNALVTIDREKKEVIYNPDYAAMKLLSQFIKPGATRVGSFSRSPLISSQVNDRYYLVVQNESDKPIHYKCTIEESEVLFELPAMSLCGVELF